MISGGLVPTSSSQLGQLWYQMRLLRASSSQILNLPRMETAQTPWATCSNAWLNLLVKNGEGPNHWHFKNSGGFTICGGVCLVREKVWQNSLAPGCYQDVSTKVWLPVREEKMWKEETKEAMPKISSKSLEVALISLHLKKDQIPFLWTHTSKVWCSKLIACHCISEVQSSLALACKRKQGVIFLFLTWETARGKLLIRICTVRKGITERSLKLPENNSKSLLIWTVLSALPRDCHPWGNCDISDVAWHAVEQEEQHSCQRLRSRSPSQGKGRVPWLF